MVYSKVMIVKGWVLTLEEVCDLFMFLRDKASDVFTWLSPSSNQIKNEGRLWFERCLVEINKALNKFGITLYRSYSPDEKHFIIGSTVMEYKRLPVECDECKEHTSCNICLGQTTNGYYNVSRLSKSFVEVENAHICEWCSSDKRTEGRCNVCKYKKLESQGMRLVKFGLDGRLPRWLSLRLPKHYYVLDGCL